MGCSKRFQEITNHLIYSHFSNIPLQVKNVVYISEKDFPTRPIIVERNKGSYVIHGPLHLRFISEKGGTFILEGLFGHELAHIVLGHCDARYNSSLDLKELGILYPNSEKSADRESIRMGFGPQLLFFRNFFYKLLTDIKLEHTIPYEIYLTPKEIF